jgi:flagellar motility protein MotE (MotC chaperone)
MADKRGVNKSAEAKVVCLAPDVCLTPMGSSMVPVAYTIESRFNVAEMTAKAVNFGGLPVFTMGSHLPKVTGDERGVGGGIISGVNMGCCKPIPGSHSTSLRIEGEWLVRHGDLMEMNCSGPKGQGNTFGKIVYIGVTPMAYVNSSGEIVYLKEEVVTDPKTGETTVRKAEMTRDPATGQLTETRQVTRIDPKTGQIETGKMSVTQDPRTGEITTTTAAGNFNPSQNQYQWRQDTGTLPGQGSLYSDGNWGGSGPVLGNDAIGTQDAFGRTYLGDGMYSSPRNGEGFRPLDAPLEVSDDDPALLNHPEYRNAVDNELAALREIERLNREMAWEASKAAVDLAGLVDPTPISDTVGGLMALKDGDFLGAGLSLLSWAPYVGDAIAKPIKGSRAAAKAAKLTKKLKELTAKLDKLKDATKKAKERVKQLLKKERAPDVNLNKAPETPHHVDGGNVPEGKLKGETVRLQGMETKKVEYKKRPEAEREKLRKEFDSKERKKFLQDAANDPDKVKQLKEHGFTDADINMMRNGRVPDGFDVHHKLPLDDGGTNAFDNLVLIKNDPFHKALTNLQNALTKGMSPGEARVLDWPVPPGFVYP